MTAGVIFLLKLFIMKEVYCQMLLESINELIESDKDLKQLFEKAVSKTMQKEDICYKMIEDGDFETYEEARDFFYQNEDWIYINKSSILLDKIISEVPKLIKSFIESINK